MPWLDLDAELSEAFGQHERTDAYRAAAYAEYERRKVVRNAKQRDGREFDRLRRVRDKIVSLPTPNVCACGKAYAMPGGLIAHGRFCKAQGQ